MPSSVLPPFPMYFDRNGSPLEGGFIYIGQPGLEPRGNPKESFADPGMDIPLGTASGAAVRTLAGYPVRDGTAVQIYVDGDYSMLVLDADGTTIFSALNASNYPYLGPQNQAEAFSPVRSIVPVVSQGSTSIQFINPGITSLADGLTFDFVPENTNSAAYLSVRFTNGPPNVDAVAESALVFPASIPAQFLAPGLLNTARYDANQNVWRISRPPINEGTSLASGLWRREGDGTQTIRQSVTSGAGGACTLSFPVDFSDTDYGFAPFAITGGGRLFGVSARATGSISFTVRDDAGAGVVGTGVVAMLQGRWFTL